MYAIYKVEVLIKADIETGTPLAKVIKNIDELPSGMVDFVEDENYLTSTEKFLPPKKGEATMQIFTDDGELLYTNEVETNGNN